MGANFHADWEDNSTTFTAASMNPALRSLDKAITYMKNIIFSCDGAITYVEGTGVLTWAGAIRIVFMREDGQAILNTVAASNITLADNEFCYVDLNETNNTVLTMAKAAVGTGSASNFGAVNRLLLGYRNAANDKFFSSWIIL